MKIMDLESKGMFIILALIIIISCACIFYFQRRFTMLENSMIQQGKILQTFIMRYNEENSNIGKSCNVVVDNELASNIAINSAHKQLNSQKIDVSDVSDDSYDSYDSDDSDDSDTNSSYISEDSDDCDNEEKIINLDSNNLSLNNDILNIELMSQNEENISNLELETKETINDLEIDANSVSSYESSNDELEPKKEFENNLKNIIESEVIGTSNDKLKNIDEINNIKKMKVNELRELVIEKGMVEDQEEASKLKKEHLLKMLQ